jgi:hypothetical protein
MGEYYFDTIICPKTTEKDKKGKIAQKEKSEEKDRKH